MSDHGSFTDDLDHDWTEGDPVENAKRRRKPAIASVVIAALLAVCVAAGAVVIGLTGLLPSWLLAVMVVVDAAVACVMVVLLFTSGPSRRKARFWVATVLSVLLMAGNAAMAWAGGVYLNTTSAIQPPTSDTILYDIVVLDDTATQVSQLDQSLMGEVGGDPLAAVVHGQVLARVKVTFAPSPSWPAMVDSLKAEDVSSMVIQDGFMQVLSDADPDTYGRLRILDSFEVDTSLATTPTPTPTSKPTSEPTNGYVLYISGMDTYGSIKTRARSDVNILMVVNPSTGKILLVNTPRDFYVQLRGTTGLPDKLTHSGVYGIDVSVGTMEDLYGITIDYYLRINFNSLIAVIDALGGVDVDSAYDFSLGGYSFHVGANHLDGAAALAFSRDRYDFEGGDRVRGQNQERVIEAIIKKASQPSVLVNYDQIMASVQDSIQTSMPQDVISAQVRQQVFSGQKWNVTSISVDGVGDMDYTYTYPEERLYVMVPDQSTVDLAEKMIQATLAGQ